MPQQTLALRVDSLERQMDELAVLPGRVAALESQVVQLRNEIKAEFSAVRADLRAGDAETRRHASVLHEEVIGRLKTLQEGVTTGGDPRGSRARTTRKR